MRCGSCESLEFDHIDYANKTAEVGGLACATYERWLAEVKKCQLLCEPCHKEKTRNDWGRRCTRSGRSTAKKRVQREFPVHLLTEALRIDEGGRLLWIERPRSHFKSAEAWRGFNAVHPGLYADAALHPNGGYRRVRITINGERFEFQAKRAAFAIKHGAWPAKTVRLDALG